MQAFQTGRIDEAKRGAAAVLARVPGEPMAAQVMGMVLMREGRDDEAVKVLRAGERHAPTHPQLLNILAVALKQAGDRDGARAKFKKAIALDRNYIEPPLNLANLEIEDDNRAAARALFDTALKLQPGHAQALSGLARLALVESDAEAALSLAEQALQAAPTHVVSLMSKAEALLMLKRFDEAAIAAKQIRGTPGVSPTNQALAVGYQAEAADKMGAFDDAFKLFSRANAMLRKLHEPLMAAAPSPYNPKTIARMRDYLAQASAPDAAPQGLKGPAPVFLMGFPRSGTTLLEQVLLAHPKIETLEEQEALLAAHDDLVLGQGGFQKLASLNQQEAQHYRDTYWAHVAALGKAAPAGGVLIDKLPLSTALLPLIAKIFPDAKILFALRDPRDVVLSCFQQRFGMTQAMYQFLNLESAASYYDLVMGVGARARGCYPLDLLDVRYEHVVDDLEAVTKEVIAFLGLGWDDGVLEYREATKSRRINTPSLTQVIEPIYSSAKGKWRNYEAAMAPALPKLGPWVQYFGYGD